MSSDQMTAYPATARVLVVQRWTDTVTPIRTALTSAHVEAEITRVDIEPALYAALAWQHYDFVIYHPATATLSLAAVATALVATRSEAVLLVADDLTAVAQQVRAVMHARRN